ncbi:Uncharacterised protein [Klebsiella pneumoniae]|nr:Uncharacterised protein [Klebsiella pneumoniae]
MAAQQKAVAQRAGLRIIGNPRRQGVNILVIIEDGDRNGIEMAMLPAKGFLHFIPLQRQRVAFFDARQHGGVDGMHMQHHVGFREQAIHQGVQTGLGRRLPSGRCLVGGDLNLQKILGCQAAFVAARLA